MTAYEFIPKSVDELETAKPLKETLVKNLSLDHLTRAENAGLIYKGYIKVSEQGIYNFFLSADDGGKLWIDDQLVVNNDGRHANIEKSGRVALDKGYHVFRLAYIQEKSAKYLELKYSFDVQEKKPVPPAMYWTGK